MASQTHGVWKFDNVVFELDELFALFHGHCCFERWLSSPIFVFPIFISVILCVSVVSLCRRLKVVVFILRTLTLSLVSDISSVFRASVLVGSVCVAGAVPLVLSLSFV